ncbi:MAG TPA: family 10 glycosylhydrolase [Planctomycetota bacterium]|jgi:hypothetical protein|nr:family 10 glycosylhydrolase [Planctomycetota bacterium]
MLLAAAFLIAASQGESPKELHGVWIATADRDAIATPARLGETMAFLLDAGANAVFVPAWCAGVANYRSEVLKTSLGIALPERDLLDQITLEAHRAGLEVILWFDPGIVCTAAADCPTIAKQPELFARDKDGKVAIEHGVARLDLSGAAGRALFKEVVLEVCRISDIDGIVGGDPVAGFAKEIAGIDAGIVVTIPPGTGDKRPGFALPALDAPDPDKGGDRLLGLAHLRAKNGELEETLRNGAWAEPALLPWRGGRIWRRRAEPIEPAAGEGTWSWAQQEGAPQFLVLNGGEHGHATWTFTPKDAGVYSLYVWIPSRADQAPKATYRLGAVVGSKSIVVDTKEPANHGWVRLGNIQLEAGKETEIARLLAEEDDATLMSAAGALLPVLNRRAMRH